MNHLPSKFDTQNPVFPPPAAPHLTANSPLFLDKQQNKLNNPTNVSPATTKNKHHHLWDKSNPEKGIGLVALVDETLNSNFSSKQQKTKLVVFGSQPKVQIPSLLPLFPSNSTTTSSSSSCSPGEFGIKTPRSNLYPNSRTGNLDFGCGLVTDDISMEEIELSEDYTCVITHRPNPRTIRIFGNCILESCFGGGVKNGGGCCSRRDNEGGFSWSEKILVSPVPDEIKMEKMESFLSFCHHCKMKIGEGNDIYMYRGEKAFCSQECRCQGMLFEDVEY